MKDDQAEATLTTKVQHCDHCQDPIALPIQDNDGHSFCCHGCLNVFSILKKTGLQEYYSIKDSEKSKPTSLREAKRESFLFLDDPNFLKDYIYQGSDNSIHIKFYIKGIHCLACLWIIEKLPDMCQKVRSSRLDFSSNIVTIALKKDEKEIGFSEVAQLLEGLGYKVFALKRDEKGETFAIQEERTLITRIGVAGFSAMNLMLYSLGIYAGAPKEFADYFGIISFFLSIPAVFYSALPFYQSAYSAIKSKKLNIDVPLAFAILFGFSISTYFLFNGKSEIYYDSLANLIFLILLSRFVLRKSNHKALNKSDFQSLFQNGSIKRVIGLNEEVEEIHSSQLLVGDKVLIETNQVFPCDGIVLKTLSDSNKSHVDNSIISGESRPKTISLNDQVFMGATLLSSPLIMEATKIGTETYVGRLVKDLQDIDTKSSSYYYLTNKISKYFIGTVLVVTVAALVFLSLFSSIEFALKASLAFVTISCPCALGLSIPLTYSRLLKLAQEKGIFIKSESVLERLGNIQNIFFDKTGTLTTGSFDIKSIQISNGEDEKEVLSQILALELVSLHPIGKSLKRFIEQVHPDITPFQFDEIVHLPAQGVKGYLSGKKFFIGKSGNSDYDVALSTEGKVLATISLKDKVRDSVKPLFARLVNDYKLTILSGDKESLVQNFISSNGYINLVHSFGALTPQEKSDLLKKSPNTLFIGDGANDTLALNKADVSIAIGSSVESALRSSDVFLINDELSLVNDALEIGKESHRIIRTNLIFSLMYNLIGGSLALAGLISPLEAAILMPLSSLTVTGYTLLKTQRGSNGNP